MPTAPIKVSFTGLDASRYFPDSAPTPPALAEDLAALDRRLLGAVSTPWVATCQHGDGGTDPRLVGARIGPGSRLLRPYIARDSDPSSTVAQPDTAFQETSAAHVALVPSPYKSGAEYYPISGAVSVAVGAAIVDETPTANEERLLLAGTPTWQPRTVRARWRYGVSLALAPINVMDLETL